MAHFLAGELLDFFACILQCFHDGDEMEHADPPVSYTHLRQHHPELSAVGKELRSGRRCHYTRQLPGHHCQMCIRDRQSSPERETSPVSQPVAPCADFSGAVEKVLDKQASGRIWAVLRGDLPLSLIHI